MSDRDPRHEPANRGCHFEDHAEPEARRHLLRLWLACDDGPALPRVFDNYTGLDARGRRDAEFVACRIADRVKTSVAKQPAVA